MVERSLRMREVRGSMPLASNFLVGPLLFSSTKIRRRSRPSPGALGRPGWLPTFFH